MLEANHRSFALAVLSLAACSDSVSPPPPRETPAASYGSHSGSGEVRARIVPPGESAVTLRSGPRVPIRLPPGFTLYPGATVLTNTRVERGGVERTLVRFQTSATLDILVEFYQAQASRAGASLSLGLAGRDHASIGGKLRSGTVFALSARRMGGKTRAELSFE